MLIIITVFIPNRRRKKGIARINKVSDTCEIDDKIFGCATVKEPAYFGSLAKPPRKARPNAFVICKAAPKNIENKKNTATLLFLKRTKASRPNEEMKLLFSFDGIGVQDGSVKA